MINVGYPGCRASRSFTTPIFAGFSEATRNFRRASALVKKKVISAEEYDEARAAVGVARANLAHAEQALAEAEVMLSYTVIKAPKSGVIVDRLAEEGDMARPGDVRHCAGAIVLGDMVLGRLIRHVDHVELMYAPRTNGHGNSLYVGAGLQIDGHG